MPARAPKLTCTVGVSLACLIDTTSPQIEKLLGTLASMGVTNVDASSRARRPGQIRYRGVRYRGAADLDWSSTEPVLTALAALVKHLRAGDQYIRFRLAVIDMDAVSRAASALADTRPDGPAQGGQLAAVDDVLETGIVVTYARSFTGAAKLGDRWRPETQRARTLHHGLLAIRDEVHAHAGHTPHRSIVDVTGESGVITILEPPFAITKISGSMLREIAEMCDRQRGRFHAEAARQYKLLRPRPENENAAS
jgi:hypothetical protein